MVKTLKISMMISFLILLATLSACSSADASEAAQSTQASEAATAKTATETPVPAATSVPTLYGAYLDNIYIFETDAQEAATQVLNGTLDMYIDGLSAAEISELKSSGILFSETVSKSYSLILNPTDTKSDTGVINPFSDTEIRSALNTLIDRSYITDELLSGGAVEKYQPVIYGSSDYTGNESIINEIAELNLYDYETAYAAIAERMESLGCDLNEDGIWQYRGIDVGISILVSAEDDSSAEIAQYTASQLISAGFAVNIITEDADGIDEILYADNPDNIIWHIYVDAIQIESADINSDSVFFDCFTDEGSRLLNIDFDDYDIASDFIKSATALAEGEYLSSDARNEILASLISSCNVSAVRIWLADEFQYTIYSDNVEFINSVTTDTASDYATVFTLKSDSSYGGSLSIGTSSLLNGAINPVGGAYYGAEYLNFINLPLTYENTDTGETVSLFIDSVQMTFQSDIEYINDTNWITTETADEIAVPSDAILGWSDETDSAVYANLEYIESSLSEANAALEELKQDDTADSAAIDELKELISSLEDASERGYLTAEVTYTVQYDESIYELVWHDGSSFSVADILMSFLTKTQLLDEDSALYDEYYAALHADELSGFKGFRVVSESPLIIEYYTDSYSLYAKDTIDPFWTDYGTGQQSWAMAAAANQAVIYGTASYFQDEEGIYLNYLSEESTYLLSETLTQLESEKYIPYSNLLSLYITEDEAAQSYRNIIDFYETYGHMAIGTGIYMIEAADTVSYSIALKAFSAFPLEAETLYNLFN